MTRLATVILNPSFAVADLLHSADMQSIRRQRLSLLFCVTRIDEVILAVVFMGEDPALFARICVVFPFNPEVRKATKISAGDGRGSVKEGELLFPRK